MKWQTVIFDMDGTVLDTLEDLLGAMNHAMRRFGFQEHTLDEMRSFVGDGLYMMAVRAVPEATDRSTVDGIFHCFKEYYSEHLNEKTRPYQGIVEMLREIKKAGMKTGISSNKYDGGAKMLSQVHFGDLIDCTVGESDAIPKKPDPAGTRLIMETLHALPESTLYVGDSGVDIETAKNAGLAMLAVSWGFRSRKQLSEAGAVQIVDSVAELRNQLLN